MPYDSVTRQSGNRRDGEVSRVIQENVDVESIH